MRRAKPPLGASVLRSAVSCRQYWRTVGQPEGIVSEQDTDHHFVHRSTIPTMHFQLSLPRFLSLHQVSGKVGGEVSTLREHLLLFPPCLPCRWTTRLKGKTGGCRHFSHTLCECNPNLTILSHLQKLHPLAFGGKAGEQLSSELDLWPEMASRSSDVALLEIPTQGLDYTKPKPFLPCYTDQAKTPMFKHSRPIFHKSSQKYSSMRFPRESTEANVCLEEQLPSIIESSVGEDKWDEKNDLRVPGAHLLPEALPIPKLEDTINRYLAAQKPLLNDQQYRNTVKIAREFGNGEGKIIHRDLLEHDRINKHTSYIAGPWYDMYLSSRDPVVFNYNPFISLNPDPKPGYNNQVVRATNLVVSALKFLNSLKNDYLRPDIYYVNRKWGQSKMFKHFIRALPPTVSWYGAYVVNAYPLDMSQYKSLFNSTRIPNLSKDTLFTSEFARHLLVMRNGHLYVFEVLDPFGNILHPSEIQAHLAQIIFDADRLPRFELSYLTTEERNTWANVRQQLVQKGNEENLKKIDSAVFCLCLDNASPQNEIELTHCFLHGYGFNRWFDKSFSLIVTSDGNAGVNFEHSWGDGVAVLRFINEVYRDSTEHPALVPESSPALFVTSCDKLEFNLNHSITSAISAARTKFDETLKKFSVKSFKYEKFGKEYIVNKNLSPDAVFQLACQMAVYRQYGKFLPSYEACSTAAFKHGRTETIRPTSVYTKKCADAFINERGRHNIEDMRNIIDECSKYHRRLQLEATLGQGFDRHLFALKYLVQRRGGNIPDIYNDPAYKNINHIIISTSTLSTPAVNHGGFGPVVPDGFGIGYNMFDTWIGCLITSYLERDLDELLRCLEYTLNDIFEVLEERRLE